MWKWNSKSKGSFLSYFFFWRIAPNREKLIEFSVSYKGTHLEVCLTLCSYKRRSLHKNSETKNCLVNFYLWCKALFSFCEILERIAVVEDFGVGEIEDLWKWNTNSKGFFLSWSTKINRIFGFLQRNTVKMPWSGLCVLPSDDFFRWNAGIKTWLINFHLWCKIWFHSARFWNGLWNRVRLWGFCLVICL